MTHIEGLYEVAINGQPYRLAQGDYARRFLDVIRQQADNSGEPSEFSLNPNDLWRRAQSEWIYGEGQLYLDDDDGLRRRYYTGGGVEAFCGCKKIHPHKAAEVVGTNTTPQDYREIIVTSDALYVRADGVETLEKIANTQTTTSAPDSGNPILAAVSVGEILLASTANGIWEYDPSGDSWTKDVNNAAATLMTYVKGRLMVVIGPDVYNVIDLGPAGSLPTSLTTDFIDPAVEWTAIGDADGYILLAGLSGQTSLIYRITIQEDGTALTSPVQLVQLPSGERVYAMTTYLGITALATSSGVRIGRFSGSDFVYGPLVYEGESRALEAKGRFVYFGMEGGVGKLDLSTFLPEEDLAPSYISSYRGAADLPVRSIVSRPPSVTIGDESDYEIMFMQDSAFESYVDFNGTSDAITFDSPEAGGDTFSLEFDIEMDDWTPAALVGWYDDYFIGDSVYIGLDSSGGLRIRISGISMLNVSLGLTDGARHTIRVDYDGTVGEVYTYIDGVLHDTETAAPSTMDPSPSATAYLGSDSDNNYMEGKIYSFSADYGGTEVFAVDFGDYPDGATSGTASTGQELTFAGGAAVTNVGSVGGAIYESQATYDTGICEFETGRVTYGMADVKNFMFLNVVSSMSDPDDQIIVYSISDDGTESVIGEVNATNESQTFFVNESGEYISFKFRFINGDATYVSKPELDRWTLRSLPVPRRTEQIIVPIDLRAAQTTHAGGIDYQDVWDQFSTLQGYVRSGETVSYQEFDRAFLATVENIQLGPDLDVDKDFSDWEGVASVTLRLYDSTVLASGGSDPDAGDNMFGMKTYGTPMFGE